MAHRWDETELERDRADGVITLWSAKGGAGTTVVAVALAAMLARRRGVGVTDDVVLVDLMGDAPLAFGTPEPADPGVLDWLAAADAVPPEALARLIRPAAAGVSLMPRGRHVMPRIERVPELLGALTAMGRPIVVDAGHLGGARDDEPSMRTRRSIVTGSGRSLLVTRPCFLSLRRALDTKVKPDGIVLLDEPGRALARTDIADVLGAPVVGVVPVEPAIARAVDAGVLAARPPADLLRSLADVA